MTGPSRDSVPDRLQFAEDRSLVIRLRRRSLREWLAWLLWFLGLVILFEYGVTSFAEHEPQAGILAGAMFAGLLVAGLIVEAVHLVESRSPYRDLPNPPETEDEDLSV